MSGDDPDIDALEREVRDRLAAGSLSISVDTYLVLDLIREIRKLRKRPVLRDGEYGRVLARRLFDGEPEDP
jgi:hypothetical protein